MHRSSSAMKEALKKKKEKFGHSSISFENSQNKRFPPSTPSFLPSNTKTVTYLALSSLYIARDQKHSKRPINAFHWTGKLNEH